MSAISNIAVYDGAATPVLHTLMAESVTRSGSKIQAIWRERISTLPQEAQVTVTMTLEKAKSGVYLLETRTEIPVMESVAGVNSSGYTAAPKVAYIDTIVSRGLFHPRSTIVSRTIARQLHLNLLGGVTTSVVPGVVGPAWELYVQLVAPT